MAYINAAISRDEIVATNIFKSLFKSYFLVMNPKKRHTWRFLWQYLNQPLFSAQFKSIWNVNRFWNMYQVNFLESCWYKDTESASKK